MSEKSDPRPARTRGLLFNALLELIQEKRWERIRVQDILERSGVGRSTFYGHYDNKFDLLTAELPSLTVPIAEADNEPDLLPLFLHVEEMAPVMKPLLTQPLLADITEKFHRRLAEAWGHHLDTLGAEPEARSMASEILAASFLAVGKHWLIDGCQPSPEAMTVEFSRYSSAVTRTALTTADHTGRSSKAAAR